MQRVALIGAGGPVRMGHAPALQALHDRYQVVALADPAAEAREEVGIILGVPPEHRYADYHELLFGEQFDIVVLSLPHALHFDAAIATLQVGAHIISERPLALSVKDAEDVLRLAESRGRQVTVAHYLLYYPPFREAIRLVREGAIGTPFLVRCEGVSGGFGPGTESYHPAWHDNLGIAGGGVWMDNGYHSVYLCEQLIGSQTRHVAAQIRTYATDLQVDDTATALLMHENGSTASIQVAWSVPSGGARVFAVYGTDGTLAMDHEGHHLGLFSNATRTWQYPQITFEHDSSYIGLYQALYECLVYGAPPPVNHREALHTLEVVMAGYRASDGTYLSEVAR